VAAARYRTALAFLVAPVTPPGPLREPAGSPRAQLDLSPAVVEPPAGFLDDGGHTRTMWWINHHADQVLPALGPEVGSDSWEDGAVRVMDLLALGTTAVLEAAATLVQTPDLSAQRSNTLALMGDLVAAALRRELLRLELLRTNWHLSETAERLRMADAGSVVREIKRDPALAAEYAEHRVRAGFRSGHKQRPPRDK
jgi:hypothetical protein